MRIDNASNDDLNQLRQRATELQTAINSDPVSACKTRYMPTGHAMQSLTQELKGVECCIKKIEAGGQIQVLESKAERSAKRHA